MISHWRNTHGGVRSCHGNVCALAWQSWRAWQFQALGVATGNSAARQKAICTIRRRSLRRKRRVKGGAYVYVLRSRHRRQEGFCEAAIRDHLSPNNYTLCTLVLPTTNVSRCAFLPFPLLLHLTESTSPNSRAQAASSYLTNCLHHCVQPLACAPLQLQFAQKEGADTRGSS